MTGINRDRLLAKIRALLSKTVANGCTESEAMVALAKAQDMMDAYEVTAEDLQLAREQRAIFGSFDGRDTHRVAYHLAYGVGRFFDVKCYTDEHKIIRFIGLPSDVEMAQWLLGTLSEFVRRELASYLHGCGLAAGQRRSAIHSFVMGATSRINKRILALKQESEAKARGNSTALVVTKAAAINDAMGAAGLRLRKTRSTVTVRNSGAYGAGQAAGDRAQFNQGVGGGQRRLA